jgi:hypothetical protein
MGSRYLSFIVAACALSLFVYSWSLFDSRRSDFSSLWSAGLAWEQGAQPYSVEAQCERQQTVRQNACLVFAHPPLILPLVSAVSTPNYQASYARWSILLVLVGAACFWLLRTISGNTRNAFFCLMFYPVYISVAMGQPTVFVLLATLLWLKLANAQHEFLSGLALSLTLFKPQIGLALGLPLLYARPRAFAGFATGGLGLALCGVALVGVGGIQEFLNLVALLASGEVYGLNRHDMFNFAALTERFGIGASLIWPLYILGIIAIALLWRRSMIHSAVAIGIISALFLSPHLHSHDLALLVVPLLGLKARAREFIVVLTLLAFALNVEHAAILVLMLGGSYLLIASLKDQTDDLQTNDEVVLDRVS